MDRNDKKPILSYLDKTCYYPGDTRNKVGGMFFVSGKKSGDMEWTCKTVKVTQTQTKLEDHESISIQTESAIQFMLPYSS